MTDLYGFTSFVSFPYVIEWAHEVMEMTSGEAIRKFRKEKGITQKKLSELTGIAEITIRQYEADKYSPKYQQIEKIASALNVHPADIMGNPYYYELWDSNMKEVQQIVKEATALDSVGAAYGEAAVSVLTDFLSLNDTGRRKAAEYIADLTEQTKYTK